MGRPSYVCTLCSEHFTRKYSAKGHNQNIHNGTAEIVRLIDYLAGRSSGQYTPDNPFWYKRNNPYHNFGGTVADSVGNTFQPRYLPQQAPLGTSQYSAGPIYPARQIIDDQSYGTSLPQSVIQKIHDLKALMIKYPKYHTNADGIIRWAIYNSINGDNTLLDDKLEQLRYIDSLANVKL
jgi:hypothetical protein